MRISDWSSDVCSSDLRFLRISLGSPNHRVEGAAGGGRTFGRQSACGVQSPSLTAGKPQSRCRAADRPCALAAHQSFDAVDVLTLPSHALGTSALTLRPMRSEEHTSELQSLMRIQYA